MRTWNVVLSVVLAVVGFMASPNAQAAIGNPVVCKYCSDPQAAAIASGKIGRVHVLDLPNEQMWAYKVTQEEGGRFAFQVAPFTTTLQEWNTLLSKAHAIQSAADARAVPGWIADSVWDLVADTQKQNTVSDYYNANAAFHEAMFNFVGYLAGVAANAVGGTLNPFIEFTFSDGSTVICEVQQLSSDGTFVLKPIAGRDADGNSVLFTKDGFTSQGALTFHLDASFQDYLDAAARYGIKTSDAGARMGKVCVYDEATKTILCSSS